MNTCILIVLLSKNIRISLFPLMPMNILQIFEIRARKIAICVSASLHCRQKQKGETESKSRVE